MKHILTTIILLILVFTCGAQHTETKYYSNQHFDNEVEMSKAKYSITNTEHDGMVTELIKDLKKDRIIHSETLKGDEPFGTWVIQKMKGTEELDYNFDIIYENKECINEHHILDYFANNPSINYIAPKIEGEKTLMSFLVNNLRFPSKAIREGLHGKVMVSFTVTKEGHVQNVVVTKGAHVVLDKEAVRLVRKLKFSAPPLFNGEPLEICVEMPISFRVS